MKEIILICIISSEFTKLCFNVDQSIAKMNENDALIVGAESQIPPLTDGGVLSIKSEGKYLPVKVWKILYN